jgi:predicted small integral membrane protein
MSERNDIDETPRIEVKSGFLPIQTNWFDRCFISVVIWVAISLFWFRFLEPLGLSIWIGTAISIALGMYIVRKG